MKICCPMCKTVIEDAAPDFPARPFCSMRCKLADLSNWMGDSYRLSRPLTDDDVEDPQLLN